MAHHSLGPTVGVPSFTSHSVLQNKTRKVFQRHWNQMQFFIHWSHKAPCEGWEMKRQSTPPWKRILRTPESPTALHTASLTKQYWNHWLRSVLVIALPHRFEWNDMDFGSVCDSRESCRGGLFFKENKLFFIKSCSVDLSLFYLDFSATAYKGVCHKNHNKPQRV